jgi:putative endonuclease
MNQKNTDKPWFIYLISNKYDQLYAGITLDVCRRFYEHASASPKCAKALKGKAPLELMFCAKLQNQSEALKTERWLKKQSRLTKDQIISGKKQLPLTHCLLKPNELHAQVMLKIAQNKAAKSCAL